jgi:2,4-dienoyl-CoA reductase [(3E)-enoyl-CoA-producing], peroxisomal
MDRLTPKDMKDAISRAVPLQRQGSVGDIANTTVFLFSEAANYITGQVIVRLSLESRLLMINLTKII